jgi:hypothetical protein
MSPTTRQSPVPRLKELAVGDRVRIRDVKYRVTDVEHRNHQVQLELAASDGGHATLIGVPGARIPSGTEKANMFGVPPVTESKPSPSRAKGTTRSTGAKPTRFSRPGHGRTGHSWILARRAVGASPLKPTVGPCDPGVECRRAGYAESSGQVHQRPVWSGSGPPKGAVA